MALLNYIEKECHLRILIDGPAYSGRSTFLHAVHRQIGNASPQPVRMRREAGETLLSFTVPLPNVEITSGFSTHLELQALTGSTPFNRLRDKLSHESDGILFVADTQWDRTEASVDFFVAASRDLHTAGVALPPMVLVYNKRDLRELAPLEYLDFLFAQAIRSLRSEGGDGDVMAVAEQACVTQRFETVATRGEGVFSALNQLITAIATHQHAEP